MRKRHIKSVAHWVIMCFILLFPIVMVGISSFGNHETINVVEEQPVYYETNEIENRQDILIGNIYHYSNNFIVGDYTGSPLLFRMAITDNIVTQFNLSANVTTLVFYLDTGRPFMMVVEDTNRYVNLINTPFDFVITEYLSGYSSIDNILSYFTKSNLKIVKDYFRVEYQQNYYMREDVNQWCNTFRNLPVNQWYGDMLDTIGLGITTSMMMNVIYTYPLYVLWVYIIDLLVDCLLVIINFGHNALKRLGGENE